MKRIHVMQRAPYKGLLSVCDPVLDLSIEKDWILQLIRLVLLEGLEGLSANQAGINKQVFVTNVRGDVVRVYINPVLTIIDYDQRLIKESCYSYPRTDTSRYRHAHVILESLRFNGDGDFVDTTESKYNPEVAIALSARIQHEMEHMHGLCIRNEPDLGEGLEKIALRPTVVSL